MNPFPFDRFEIRPLLSAQSAIEKLKAHIDAPQLGRLESGSTMKIFEGRIWNDHFSLQRTIRGLNPFLPHTLGHVLQDQETCRIVVIMRPSIAALATMLCVSVGALAVSSIGPFVVALLYLMAMVGFWPDALQQRRILRQIFMA